MVKKWRCNVKEGKEERKHKSAVSKVPSLLLRAVAPLVFSRVCTRFPCSVVEFGLVAVADEEQRCSCRLQEVLRSCFFSVCVRGGFWRIFFFFGFCFASRTESLDRGFACLVS